MPKNRKREGALLKLLPLTKWLVVCGIIATIGFGYNWQKISIYKLGDDIRIREQQLDALQKRNLVLRDQVAGLTSPRALKYKCEIWKLGLDTPKESQIVRVLDPMLIPTKSNGEERLTNVAQSPSHRIVAQNVVREKVARGTEVRND